MNIDRTIRRILAGLLSIAMITAAVPETVFAAKMYPDDGFITSAGGDDTGLDLYMDDEINEDIISQDSGDLLTDDMQEPDTDDGLVLDTEDNDDLNLDEDLYADDDTYVEGLPDEYEDTDDLIVNDLEDEQYVTPLGGISGDRLSGTIYASELSNKDYYLDGDTTIILRENDDVTINRIWLVSATTRHNLTIEGSDKGKLTVTGQISNGSGSNTYESKTLKINGGTVVCHDIMAPDKLEINGGKITTEYIRVADDIEINGGYIDINQEVIDYNSHIPVWAKNGNIDIKGGELHCKYYFTSGNAESAVMRAAEAISISGGKTYIETDCSDGLFATEYEIGGFDTYLEIKVTGNGSAFREGKITVDSFKMTDPVTEKELHLRADGNQLLDPDDQPAKNVAMQKILTYGIETDKAEGIAFAETSYGYAAPTATITVTNTKTGPVTLKGIKLSKTTKFESKDFTETTIDPEQTYTFTIKPKEYVAVGTYNETLTITTDRPDVTATVPLSYTVKPVVNKLQTTPASLDFGTYKRAYDGSYTVPVSGKKATIKNNGTETVTLDRTVVHADYDVTYPEDVELAAGESAELMIRPKEDLAAGNHDSVFFVKTTDGIQTGIKIKLSVQNIKYSISADKTRLDFGRMNAGYQNAPAEKSIKITNKGEANVTLNIPEVESYDISPAPGDVLLAPGKSLTLTIRPQTDLKAGTYSRKLEITTPEGPSAAIDINFEKGYYLLGTVNASDLVDNASYTLIGDTTINIAAGDEKTIKNILDDDGDYNLTIQGSDAGKLSVSDEYGIALFTDTNVTAEYYGYTNKFIIKGGTLDCTSVTSGGDLYVLGGRINCNRIVSNSGDVVISAGSVSATNFVTGAAVYGQNVMITGGKLTCEAIAQSITSSGNLYGTIKGEKSITFSGGYVTAENKYDESDQESYALSAPEITFGENAYVTAATANGTEAVYPGSLTIADGLKATDLATGEAVSVAPEGSENAGHLVNTSNNRVKSVRFEKNDMTTGLTLSTSEVDFGTLNKGYDVSPSQTILVTNTGTMPVSLPSVTSDPNPSHFDVGSYSNDILLAGETASFTVSPKYDLTEDPYSETLSIDLTAVGGEKYSFTAGVIIKSPVISIAASSGTVDFGTFPRGYTVDGEPGQTIMFTNTGEVPVEFDSVNDPEHFVLSVLTGVSLAPGESMTATVSIDPEVYDEEAAGHISDRVGFRFKYVFKNGSSTINRFVYLEYSTVAPGTDGIWIEPIPDQTYNGTALKPAVNVYYMGMKLNAKDYTVSYKNNTNAYTFAQNDAGFTASGAPAVTVKGKGNYAGTATAYFVINPLDIYNATAPDMLMNYNGSKAQLGKTKVTYLLNGKTVTLKENKDFKYVWETDGEGNVKDYKTPGTYTTGIEGMGNYAHIDSHSATPKTYKQTIISADQVLMSAVSMPSVPEQKYSGSSIVLKTNDDPAGEREAYALAKNGAEYEFILKDPKTKQPLVCGLDYTLSYENNKATGIATVTVTGKGNEGNDAPGAKQYFGTRTLTFKINGTKLSSLGTEGFVKEFPYNGFKRPQPMRFYYTTGKGKTAVKHYLTEGIDYTATYLNNVEIGTATVTYTGIDPYIGTVVKTYKIKGIEMKSLTIPSSFAATTGSFVTEGYDEVAYTAVECYNAKSNSFIYTGLPYEVAGKPEADSAASNNGIQVRLYDKKTNTYTYYTNGVDYYVTYEKNVNPGTATVIFTGKGKLTGSVKKTFKIAAYNIKDDVGDRLFIYGINNSYTYNKGGVKPKPVVSYSFQDESSLLEEGTDYTLKWSNNNAITGPATKNKPTVSVTGKGLFTGTYTKNFAVTGNVISEATVNATMTDVIYQEKAGICKTTLTLTDKVTGVKLAPGTDYDKNLIYRYAANTDVRTREKVGNKYVISAPDDTTPRAAGEEVDQAVDVIPVGTWIDVWVTPLAKGKYNASNAKTKVGSFRFIDAKNDISKMNIVINPQIYDGTNKKDELGDDDFVFLNGKTVIEPAPGLGTAYRIEEVAGSDYTNKGTHKVKLVGITENGYTGSKIVSFTINARTMDYTIFYVANFEALAKLLFAKYPVEGHDVNTDEGLEWYLDNYQLVGTPFSSVTTRGGKLAKYTFTIQKLNDAGKWVKDTSLQGKIALDGWTQNPDGSGTSYANQGPFSPSWFERFIYGDDHTLYAKWTVK